MVREDHVVEWVMGLKICVIMGAYGIEWWSEIDSTNCKLFFVRNKTLTIKSYNYIRTSQDHF